MSPLVSILIPCFNAEHLVGQAIESALAQTWPHKEVIVVDDGSTDASLEVIRRFDRRIRWESGPNRGGNVARNRLLELSSGGSGNGFCFQGGIGRGFPDAQLTPGSGGKFATVLD